MSNIKYLDIKARYDTIEGEKAPYNMVVKRIIHNGRSKEKALTVGDTRKILRVGDEYGRPCSKCKVYYTRDGFHRKRKYSSKYPYDSSCKECKRLDKKRYYNEIGPDEIKKRQARQRHIEIGSLICIQDYIHYDDNGNPREVVWEVIAYKPYLGYTLISKDYGLKKIVAFRSCIGNYKFYVIEKPKEKVIAPVIENNEFEFLRM